MQPKEYEFTRPSSPALTKCQSDNVQIRTCFDKNVPPNGIIHVTSFSSSDALLDDSSDSFLENDDTEDISMPGEPQDGTTESYPSSFMSALKKAVGNNPGKTENNVSAKISDPYHVPSNRFQTSSNNEEISPQTELKHLLKNVESSKPTTPEYSPQESTVVDKLTMDLPGIEIIKQPETTYRARYESEGCKGPIHGASETGFPSIKIVGYVGEVVVTVFVVTRDNEPHLHTATGPGSSKALCNEVILDDDIHAIQMLMKPTDENDDMIAVFDQLSIRRVRNWEADRELRKRGIEPASWKSKKKEAKLAFQATITPTKNHPGYVLTSYSRLFLCTAPSGNPEIWWVSLNECSPEGGEEMGFIGKKFASGFKIRFFSKEDDGNTWEVYAEVDKTKSSQNACVVKVPAYKETVLNENVVVHVEIRVGPEKEPRFSDPYPFTYTAPKKMESCSNCTQIKSFLQRMCVGESKEIPVDGIHVNSIKDSNVTPIKSEEASTTTNNNDVLPQKATGIQPQQVCVASNLRTLLQHSAVNTVSSKDSVHMYYMPKVQDVSGMIPTKVTPITLNTNMNQVSNQPRIINIGSQKLILPQALSNLSVSGSASALPLIVPKPVISTVTCLPNLQTVTHILPQQGQYLNVATNNQNLVHSTNPLISLNIQPVQHSNLQVLDNANLETKLGEVKCSQLSSLTTNHVFEKVKEEQMSPKFPTNKHTYQTPMDYSNENSQFNVLTNNQSLSSDSLMQTDCSTGNNTLLSSSTLQPSVKLFNAAAPNNKSFVQTFSQTVPTQDVNIAVNNTLPLQKKIESLTNYLQNLKKQLAVEPVDISTLQYNIYQQQNNSFRQQPQHTQTTFQAMENHQNQSMQHFDNIQQKETSQPLIQQQTVFQVNQDVAQFEQSNILTQQPSQRQQQQQSHQTSYHILHQGLQSSQIAQNITQEYEKQISSSQSPFIACAPQTVLTSQTPLTVFQQNSQEQQHNTEFQQQLQTQQQSQQQNTEFQQQLQTQLQQQQLQSQHQNQPHNTDFQQQLQPQPLHQQPSAVQVHQQSADVAQLQQQHSSVVQMQKNQAVIVQLQHQQPAAVQLQQQQPFAKLQQSQSSVQMQQEQQTNIVQLQQQPTVVQMQQQPSVVQMQNQPTVVQLQQQPAVVQMQQQQLVTTYHSAPSERMLNNINHCISSDNENRWERPTINDAIATNKVGFKENEMDGNKSSRAGSPMEIKISDDTENTFLQTYHQSYNNSLPTTPTCVNAYNTIQAAPVYNSIPTTLVYNSGQATTVYQISNPSTTVYQISSPSTPVYPNSSPSTPVYPNSGPSTPNYQKSVPPASVNQKANLFSTTDIAYDAPIQQQINQDKYYNEEDDFSQSTVSVDYSDNFKNMSTSTNPVSNWSFQKTAVEQTLFRQSSEIYTSTSTPNGTEQRQQGW